MPLISNSQKKDVLIQPLEVYTRVSRCQSCSVKTPDRRESDPDGTASPSLLVSGRGEMPHSHVSFNSDLPRHSSWEAGLHTPSSKTEITRR